MMPFFAAVFIDTPSRRMLRPPHSRSHAITPLSTMIFFFFFSFRCQSLYVFFLRYRIPAARHTLLLYSWMVMLMPYLLLMPPYLMPMPMPLPMMPPCHHYATLFAMNGVRTDNSAILMPCHSHAAARC